MACRWCSTKWNLQLRNSYKVHTYVTACIHSCATCQVYSRCEFIKPTTSVYIVCKQLRRQPVVHMLACSEYFAVHVVPVLFHTQVFLKFKSSCTVYT